MTRADLFDLLYARVSDPTRVQVQYSTRTWVTPSELASKNRLPALEFAINGWSNDNDPKRPSTSILEAMVSLHVKAQDNDNAVAKLMSLANQVDLALRSQEGERGGWHTTLGGKVQHAWISNADIFEGDVVGYAKAELTVQMLAVIN